MDDYLKAAALADLFGLSERRVNQLKAEKVLVPIRDKGFPVIASVKAYVEFLRREDEKGRDAKARKESAFAEQAELNLAERRGELIPVAQVTKIVSDVAMNVKARLRNLPPRLAREVQDKDIASSEAVIREGIDEALQAIANVEVEATTTESSGPAV